MIHSYDRLPARMAVVAACVFFLGLLPGAGRTRDANAADAGRPRPVSVLVLRESDPSQRLRLSGAVQSWKQQDLSFDVSGRVAWTIGDGADIEGRTHDEKGRVLTEGTVLARLDSERYKLAVESARAELRAREAKMAAAEIEIAQLLPARLRGARGRATRVSKECERQKELFEREAGTQADVDTAVAELAQAKADVEQVEADLAAAKAELGRIEAEIGQAQHGVKKAELDLADCVLRSPFHGRVSHVSVIPGAFVAAGRAILTVVVMDPIKVEVAVSPATDRHVAVSDVVQVYPPGMSTPVEGVVQAKETSADPRTRTFGLSVMVRNRRVVANASGDASALPSVERLTRPQLLQAQPGDPLCVPVQAILGDSGRPYVLKAEGILPGQLASLENPVITLRRVAVQLGERRRALLGVVLREVTAASALTPQDLILLDPPPGLEDGARVAYVRRRWLFRPGDVADVLLQPRPPARGYYVPMGIVKPVDNAEGHVFVVRDGKAGRARVRLAGHVDDRVRIEPADAAARELLQAGTQLIAGNVHFIVEGESVAVVGTKGKAP